MYLVQHHIFTRKQLLSLPDSRSRCLTPQDDANLSDLLCVLPHGFRVQLEISGGRLCKISCSPHNFMQDRLSGSWVCVCVCVRAPTAHPLGNTGQCATNPSGILEVIPDPKPPVIPTCSTGRASGPFEIPGGPPTSRIGILHRQTANTPQ